jgi:hypothetical protein
MVFNYSLVTDNFEMETEFKKCQEGLTVKKKDRKVREKD